MTEYIATVTEINIHILLNIDYMTLVLFEILIH